LASDPDSNGVARVAIGIVAAALPFLAYGFFILDHFYRAGACSTMRAILRI